MTTQPATPGLCRRIQNTHLACRNCTLTVNYECSADDAEAVVKDTESDGGKAFTLQADMSDANGARDLALKGITVNCIQPGPIDTALNPVDGEIAPAITPMTAVGRYGNTDEVADLVAFVASPRASYITGVCLNVDGGVNA